MKWEVSSVSLRQLMKQTSSHRCSIFIKLFVFRVFVPISTLSFVFQPRFFLFYPRHSHSRRLLQFVIFLFIARLWNKKKKKNPQREHRDVLCCVLIKWTNHGYEDIKLVFRSWLHYHAVYSEHNEAGPPRAVAVVAEQFIRMRWLQIPWAGFLGHRDVFYFNGIRPSTAQVRFKSFLWRSPADSSFNKTLIPLAPGRPFGN